MHHNAVLGPVYAVLSCPVLSVSSLLSAATPYSLRTLIDTWIGQSERNPEADGSVVGGKGNLIESKMRMHAGDVICEDRC